MSEFKTEVKSLSLLREIRERLSSNQSSLDAILNALGNLALEVTAEQINLNTDTLEASNDAIQVAVESIDSKTTLKSNKYRLENEANDLVQTFTYLDAGTDDERVETITYSSVALSLTVTETFAYAGSSGSYRVSTITLS